MVSDAEVGEDEAGCQFGDAFFDGHGIAAEALFEVAIEAMTRSGGVSAFVHERRHVRRCIPERSEHRHEDVVEIDAVVGVIGAVGDRDLQRLDEGVGMREALGLRQQSDRLGLIAFDLCEVEHRKGASEDPAVDGLFIAVMVIVGARCRLLPEHDGRAVFTLAEQGHAEAQGILGAMLFVGKDVAVDHAEGIRWLQRAAEQGDAEAQTGLGKIYQAGVGVAIDHAEAIRWIRKAAEQGDAEAQFMLGSKYYEGVGVAIDHAEGLRWLRKAAEQQSTEAQTILGTMYKNGVGVTTDYGEALRWFRKAAEQGQADAQFELGTMYYYGAGVVADRVEALQWLRKAADQGDPEHQYILGIVYRSSKDGEAVYWLTKAAEQDNADAQHALGFMYLRGEGTSKERHEGFVLDNGSS